MKIHFIAIGGSAMHNLAIALHNLGHTVTGSDDEIFEPSGSRLRQAGLLPEEQGWFPEKLNKELDAVILGMHAKADNPELQKARELKLRIYSYPEFIYEHSRNKQRIVIGGSHGKTTITSMILHVLKSAGRKFDYLVGAKVHGFDTMVKLSNDAPVIVLEGDEYLSSTLDRRPKFLVYKAHLAVISGVAWDHINVFPTEESYVQQFALFIEQLDKAGMLVYNEEDRKIRTLVKKYARPQEHYLYPYSTPLHKLRDGKWEIKLEGEKMQLEIFGRHNISNLSAAWKVCKLLAVDIREFMQHISTFRGADMRLQKIHEDSKNIIFKDFAHSPSKVKASVGAVAEMYDRRNIIACLELHTFSSLNREFLRQYRRTLKLVRKKIVFVNEHTVKMKNMVPLTREDIQQSFDDRDIVYVTNREALVESLNRMRGTHNILLMMSSGNFDNLDLLTLATA